jgi:peptidoglycan/xylan/chitin deacetylase (PgdA/CDA1 family)
MDWDQLREMSNSDISIQSHTTSHRPLSEISESEIAYELETSKKTIQDHLGTQVNFLSFPHGVFNESVMKLSRDAGYQAVCSSEPGYLHEFKDFPVMKRINITHQLPIDMFKGILEKNEAVIRPMLMSKKIKNLAKKVVGYDLYRKVYNLRYQGKG